MSEVGGGLLQRTVTTEFANVFWLVVVEVNLVKTCGYFELSRFGSTGLPSCLKRETELFHWLWAHIESESTLWVTKVTCVLRTPQFFFFFVELVSLGQTVWFIFSSCASQKLTSRSVWADVSRSAPYVKTCGIKTEPMWKWSNSQRRCVKITFLHTVSLCL